MDQSLLPAHLEPPPWLVSPTSKYLNSFHKKDVQDRCQTEMASKTIQILGVKWLLEKQNKNGQKS